MDLVLFGIQGSGKGTQARKLAEEFGYYLFETGGELRTIAASGTELGNTVKDIIDQGQHVPTEIVMAVVKEAVMAQPSDQKILFDGIPRNEDQLDAFNMLMKDAKREFQCVEILLSKEEAIERIKARASIEGRADDADEESIYTRINLFEEKTVPVIRSYEASNQLLQVDGSGTIDEVYTLLKNIVQ